MLFPLVLPGRIAPNFTLNLRHDTREVKGKMPVTLCFYVGLTVGVQT